MKRCIYVILISLFMSSISRSGTDKAMYPDVKIIIDRCSGKNEEYKYGEFEKYLSSLNKAQLGNTFKASLLLINLVTSPELVSRGYNKIDDFYTEQIEIIEKEIQDDYLIPPSKVLSLKEDPLSIEVFDPYYKKLKPNIPSYNWGKIYGGNGLPLMWGDISEDDKNTLTGDNKMIAAAIPKLIRNGIYIDMTEGIEYARKLPFYLETIFEGRLPKEEAEYYDLSSEFEKQRVIDDGGLIVGPEELVKRIVILENYMTRYPKGKYFQDCTRYAGRLIRLLKFGANNSPIYDGSRNGGDKGPVHKEFRDAYLDFITKHKNSRYYQEVKKHWELLVKHNFFVSDDLLYHENEGEADGD
ncbi:MAG: hypothetical protein ABII64_00910 [Elusimicrobiota bacterium]